MLALVLVLVGGPSAAPGWHGVPAPAGPLRVSARPWAAGPRGRPRRPQALGVLVALEELLVLVILAVLVVQVVMAVLAVLVVLGSSALRPPTFRR